MTAVIRCFARNEWPHPRVCGRQSLRFFFQKFAPGVRHRKLLVSVPGQGELDVAVSIYCSDCPASAFSGVFLAASVSVCFIIAQQSAIIPGMDAIFA